MTTRLDKVSEDAENELLKAEQALIEHIEKAEQRGKLSNAAKADLAKKYPALRAGR